MGVEMEGGEEGQSKAELEKLQTCLEADATHAAAMLKADPKCGHFVGMLEKKKAELATVKQKLRGLQKPEGQMRNKALRLARLTADTSKRRAKLRTMCNERDDLNETNEEEKEKIQAQLAQCEQIKSEQRVLALVGGEVESATPVDLGVAVRSMQADFTKLFVDPSLPQGVKERKGQVESMFAQLAELLQSLSAFQASVQTDMLAAKAQAEVASTGEEESRAPGKEAEGTEAPAGEKDTGEKETGTGKVEQDAPAASQKGRGRGGERRPPPPPLASTETVVGKKARDCTDDELLGPAKVTRTEGDWAPRP